MKEFLAVLILMFAGISSVLAQTDQTVELKRTEMKKVEKMVGQWKGAGWIQQGPKRETFTGTETVQRKLDGLALLVEGKFSNDAGKVIHETMAVISYEPKETKFDFRTYLASGLGGDYEIKPAETGWLWGFNVEGGTIRYNIRIENDTWSEIGEFSKDGKTWMKFFEMNLKKIV